MTAEVWGMIIAGVVALVAGLILVLPRFQAARGIGKIFALALVFEAVPLAIFGAEHFFAAHDMTGIVPKWLPWHLFWVYFFGVALLAAAISFILWRCVSISASLLALFFLLVVVTVDLPNLFTQAHDRIFWTLLVRELCFAGGALALAGSLMGEAPMGKACVFAGRTIVALVMIFYGIEHFFFPHNVPGVPLEKITPGWIPASAAITYFIGIILIVAGAALLLPRTARIASAAAGGILVLLVIFFYLPIAAAELHSDLAVEGINYVGDTLLFAATILLAGLASSNQPDEPDRQSAI